MRNICLIPNATNTRFYLFGLFPFLAFTRITGWQWDSKHLCYVTSNVKLARRTIRFLERSWF